MQAWALQAVKGFRRGGLNRRQGVGSRRLITVTNDNRGNTMRPLTGPLAERGVRHERWPYSRLFKSRRLPQAVYVLTDFDRLVPWHVELAARLYCRLTAEGVTVLNDPRCHLPRWAFLRRLRAEGVNDFDCWLPAEGALPDRFPVFLRTIHAHRGVASGLLQDVAEAEAALREALAEGLIVSDLVFVEYAAEPHPETGKFRKHAAYRVGDRIIRALSVTEESWIAKNGSLGAATDADYTADLAEHQNYPHAALMRKAFDIAGMGFGRIDYGFVGGRPQIYELNTNPQIGWGRKHPNPDRRSASGIVRDELLDGLAALCRSDAGRMVDVSDAIPRSILRRENFQQP